jgi:hypothetical protein
VLVDRIVCEVHKCAAKIGSVWALVRSGAETNQAFFVNEDAKWVDAGDENINAQVKFETVD